MAKKKTDKADAAKTDETLMQDGAPAVAADEQKPEEKSKAKPAERLRISAPAQGFRRAGRRWVGVCEIGAEELSADQIAAIRAEPKLTLEEI